MELTKEELQLQLKSLKDDFDKAFSQKMKDSIKVDIEALEAKMDASSKKSIDDLNDKLAKVIETQDKHLADAQAQRASAASKEIKSFGQLLGEAMEENADAIAKFAKKESKSVSFQLKAVADMGFAGNFGSASQSVATVRPGIIYNPSRKVHIRDLVPQGTMDGSTFYYVAENGNGEGNPAPVLENNFKEQMDLDLVERNANAEYIAGWLRISKKMLADVKGMTSFLQMRLPEKLKNAEDNQLLNGNGTSPQVSGIIGGNHYLAYNQGAGADIEELILAISQLEDSAEREANGILVRPRNLARLVLNKASGSGEYDLPDVVRTDPNTGVTTVLGTPIYASTAMASDKFLVGDWRMGAMLLTREPAVVEMFYEDGTNVRENKVTVRVEERVAFPVFGDNYFVYGDFGNS